MKTFTEIRAEFEALATVTEDQYEAALATALADFDATVAGTTPTAPVATGVVITFSDNSTQTLPTSASTA